MVVVGHFLSHGKASTLAVVVYSERYEHSKMSLKGISFESGLLTALRSKGRERNRRQGAWIFR